mmetsp:Transcript_42002/g.82917  ORF Transcript_42002/g.82917 Transcript_42002/m.82917 type:complete len:236 (+) Transcript_42002:1535-2242(+)
MFVSLGVPLSQDFGGDVIDIWGPAPLDDRDVHGQGLLSVVSAVIRNVVFPDHCGFDPARKALHRPHCPPELLVESHFDKDNSGSEGLLSQQRFSPGSLVRPLVVPGHPHVHHLSFISGVLHHALDLIPKVFGEIPQVDVHHVPVVVIIGPRKFEIFVIDLGWKHDVLVCKVAMPTRQLGRTARRCPSSSAAQSSVHHKCACVNKEEKTTDTNQKGHAGRQQSCHWTPNHPSLAQQ